MNRERRFLMVGAGLLAAILLAAAPDSARGHCDAMDGPVVQDARLALERGDVTPVLKWVLPEDEAPIRESFRETLKVRAQGDEAQALADRYFFETVVRIHRAGEGAPYTGLKPAGQGTDSGPAVEMTDKALEKGSAGELVQFVTDHVEKGLRKRFEHVLKTRRKADQSVKAGREFVEAYVDLVHYAKHVYAAADREGGPHGEGASASLHEGAAHP